MLIYPENIFSNISTNILKKNIYFYDFISTNYSPNALILANTPQHLLQDNHSTMCTISQSNIHKLRNISCINVHSIAETFIIKSL